MKFDLQVAGLVQCASDLVIGSLTGVDEDADCAFGAGAAKAAHKLARVGSGHADDDVGLGEPHRSLPICRLSGSPSVRRIALRGHILVIAWHPLSDDNELFHDLGRGYYDSRVKPPQDA